MSEPQKKGPLTRRHMLQGAAAAGVAALVTETAGADEPLKGKINHSVVFWCFNIAGEKWDIDTTCRIAKELGCKSVEIVEPEHWGVLKKHGLICAIAPNGMPGADAGVPNVISFTGYKWRDAEDDKSGEIPSKEAFDNCVQGFKAVVGHAEKRKVTICLEHLNTRDATHPMKGHPGYGGDQLDFMADIVRKVDSPRLKLLFDIYHVQVMHGDLIRRIEENKDIIGHVHTAGCPGRGELDDTQEIRYPAVVRKLLEIKYAGYVGHEFIPTRAPKDGLREAIRLCDV
jgi:hydroxypyruvate isomerase